MIEALFKQIGGPRDGALLRYSLGHALLGAGDSHAASEQLRAAVEFDANYSVAWKILGQALQQQGDFAAAMAAWQQGIAVANQRGDVQAAKEMAVFLRRLEKVASKGAVHAAPSQTDE